MRTAPRTGHQPKAVTVGRPRISNTSVPSTIRRPKGRISRPEAILIRIRQQAWPAVGADITLGAGPCTANIGKAGPPNIGAVVDPRPLFSADVEVPANKGRPAYATSSTAS